MTPAISPVGQSRPCNRPSHRWNVYGAIGRMWCEGHQCAAQFLWFVILRHRVLDAESKIGAFSAQWSVGKPGVQKTLQTQKISLNI